MVMTTRHQVEGLVSLPVDESLGEAVQAESVQATSHGYHLLETNHVAFVERKVTRKKLSHKP